MPPLVKNLVRIPAGGGVDYFTDALSVKPPKLIECLNGSFRSPGRVETRFGLVTSVQPNGWDNVNAAAVTITKGFGLTTLGEAPVMLAHEGLFVAGKGVDLPAGGWTTNGRMPLPSVSMAQLPWSPPSAGALVTNADSSVVQGVSSSVATTAIEVAGTIYVTTTDLISGNPIAQYTISSLGFGNQVQPRLMFGGAGVLFATTGGRIGYAQITGANPGALVPVVLEADLNTALLLFDADDQLSFSTTATVAYYATTANTIRIFHLTANGTIGTTLTFATAAVPSTLGVARSTFASSPASAIMWTEGTATAKVRMYNSALVLTLATTTANASGLPAGTAKNITGVFTDASTLAMFWEIAGATADLNIISRSRVTSAGVVSTDMAAAGWMRHSGLASKAFVKPSVGTTGVNAPDNMAYVFVVHVSTLQSTYYLVAMQFSSVLDGTIGNGYDPLIVGQLLPGAAKGLTTWLTKPSPDSGGFISGPGASGTLVAVALQQARLIGTSTLGPLMLATLDMGGRQPTRAEVGGSLYFPGGIVWEYDGIKAVENGLLLAPEGVTATSVATGSGALVNGTSYSYLVFYESHNALGYRRVSAMTGALTVTCTGNTIQLSIPTLAHTNRATVGLAIYRQLGDGEYHRVSLSDPGGATGINGYCGAGCADLTNPGSTRDVAVFQDGMSDATLAVQELAPTTDAAGQPVDNISPPACRYIASGNGRVFLAGFQDSSLIWHSKTRETGEAVDFSDVLTILVPEGRGPITAIAVFQDALIVFRKTQMYVVSGDGPDNSATGGSFNTARLISDVIGCEDAVSIVQLPGMLAFRSSGSAGIFSWDNTNGIKHLGADLAGFLRTMLFGSTVGYLNPVLGAQCVGNAVIKSNEVRWSVGTPTSGANIFVFNYLGGQWSRWTLDAANTHTLLGAAATSNGVFITLCARTSDGAIRGEVLIDDPQLNCVDKVGGASFPFPLQLVWPWITGEGAQGANRLYKLLFLGFQIGSAVATVTLGLDPLDQLYQGTPETHTIALDQAATPDGAVFEVRPVKQRFERVKVSLVLTSPSGGNALLGISELAMEIGVSPTLGRRPVSRRTT